MRFNPRLPFAGGLLALTAAAGGAHAQGGAGCQSAGELEYVCGPQNAEDILELADTDWLIVSGMSGGGPGERVNGHIYLLDRESREYREWFPGESPRFAHDRATFADCPGPIDVENFSAHGLALTPAGGDRYRMYMTSHDAREAIEVFDVSTAGDAPSLTWVGCVVLPSSMFSNSVAILADGGFVTTKMMDREDPEGFAGIRSGNVTGGVYEWHPGGELALVEGTELSGANGIVVSDDERYLYVAALGSGELVRFDRETLPMGKQVVALPITPDNIRWGDDGMLYTAGGDRGGPGQAGWSVVRVDPAKLEARRIAGAPAGTALGGVSVALPAGDEIWIGTFSGDRVGILPRP